MSPHFPRVAVFVAHAATMGGASWSLLEFLRRMPRSEWDPLVVLPEDGDLCAHLRKERIRYVIQPVFRWYFSAHGRTPFTLRQIMQGIGDAVQHAIAYAALLRREQPALVCVCSLYLPLTAFLSRRAGRPVVWWVHGVLGDRPPWMARLYAFWLRRYAGHVFFVSGLARRAAHASVTEKSSVTHPVIDASEFRPREKDPARLAKWSLDPHDLVLGMVGLTHKMKGHLYVLKALLRLQDELPRLKLLIIGGPTLAAGGKGGDDLPFLIHSFGLASRVRMTGYQEPVSRDLSLVDALIFPSIAPDAFGRAVVEAMLMEKPVIVSQFAGGAEIVRHGHSGFVVDPKDTDQVCGALREIFVDGKRRTVLGARARQAAEAYVEQAEDDLRHMKDVLSRLSAHKTALS